MPSAPLTLFEATLTLYPAAEDGSAIIDQPVWMGVCVERVRLSSPFLRTETRPTGRPFPRQHPLVQAHQIDLGRVWALPLFSLESFIPVKDRYVLDIVWEDEDTNLWKRRTYFGVTIREVGLESQDPNSTASQFIEEQSFDAEFFTEASGGGTPPEPTLTYPMFLRWVGGSGEVRLYNYLPSSGLFVEASADVAGSRLVIDRHLAFAGGYTNLTFALSEDGAQVNSGILNVDGEFRPGEAPSLTDVPRVEFWRGPSRFASLTANGDLFAPNITEGTPQSGVDRFYLNDSGLVATIAADGIVATHLRHKRQPLTMTGIPSAEAFGIATLTLFISPDGIASAEAFGTATIPGHITATGIASAEAFGTPSISQIIHPTGIPSAEAFGAATLPMVIRPSAIASGQAFGTPQLGWKLHTSGIASGEAFGTPSIIKIIHPAGIASAEGFGAAVVTQTSVVIRPAGIPSEEAFGFDDGDGSLI